MNCVYNKSTQNIPYYFQKTIFKSPETLNIVSFFLFNMNQFSAYKT